MIYAIESWTMPTDDDEEPVGKQQVSCEEYEDEAEAMRCAWQRMEEGYFVRLWRR